MAKKSKVTPTQASDLRLIYPNGWGAINATKEIRDIDDIKDLLAECTHENMTTSLIRNHALSRELLSDSSLSVHKIVSLQILVQKVPYSYRTSP